MAAGTLIWQIARPWNDSAVIPKFSVSKATLLDQARQTWPEEMVFLLFEHLPMLRSSIGLLAHCERAGNQLDQEGELVAAEEH